MEGFTFKCNKCGTEIIITSRENAEEIMQLGGGDGWPTCDIYCPNPDCNNSIEDIG